jgi:hypothetical protein
MTVGVALFYDAWGRPDPDLPKKLRDKATYSGRFGSDPNYEAHLDDFLKKGLSGQRSDPEMPSKLR